MGREDYVSGLRKLVGSRPLILNGSIVIIKDAVGRILLQQRQSPRGWWGLPGGLMELGESTEETVRREVFEETGLTLGVVKLVNIYSGKDYFVRVVENGDEFYVVTTLYETQEFSGELSVHDEESLGFRWLTPAEIASLTIVHSQRKLLEEYLEKLEKNADA